MFILPIAFCETSELNAYPKQVHVNTIRYSLTPLYYFHFFLHLYILISLKYVYYTVYFIYVVILKEYHRKEMQIFFETYKFPNKHSSEQNKIAVSYTSNES